jgi:alkylation response protein AidB-like acyl-CoA dehydrogenase
MLKLGLFASIAAIVGALSFASTRTADAGDACSHTDFKTAMVKAACQKGGQAAAKEAMQAFNKEKHIASCNKCHSSLKPKYDLKDDGLKQFQDLKGDDSAAAKAVTK